MYMMTRKAIAMLLLAFGSGFAASAMQKPPSRR
jgi:hypothetical protein